MFSFFYLDKVANQDSFYNRFNCLGKYDKDKIIELSIVKSARNDDILITDDSEFFIKNDTLYRGTMQADEINSKNKDSYKVISQFKKANGVYMYDKDLKFILPSYLVDQNIGFNLCRFMNTDNFLGFPLFNYFIDLKNNDKIAVPIPDSVYQLNSNFMTDHKLKYSLQDFKYNKKLNQIYFLYYINEFYYLTILKNKTETYTKKIGSYKDSFFRSLSSFGLSKDATEIVYTLESCDCIQRIKL